MLPRESKNEPEVFDATTDDTDDAPRDIDTEIAEAKKRADHQNMVAKYLVDDIIEQKKKSFRRTVVLSVGSVVVLLVLAIVFFVYLHWYGAGAGVAIIAFGVAQLWLNYFKKWDKANPEFDDIVEADGSDIPRGMGLPSETPPTQPPHDNETKEQAKENQDAGS